LELKLKYKNVKHYFSKFSYRINLFHFQFFFSPNQNRHKYTVDGRGTKEQLHKKITSETDDVPVAEIESREKERLGKEVAQEKEEEP